MRRTTGTTGLHLASSNSRFDIFSTKFVSVEGKFGRLMRSVPVCPSVRQDPRSDTSCQVFTPEVLAAPTLRAAPTQLRVPGSDWDGRDCKHNTDITPSHHHTITPSHLTNTDIMGCRANNINHLTYGEGPIQFASTKKELKKEQKMF